MKKIFLYILFIFLSAQAFAQIDSVPYFFSAPDRQSMWQKKSNVPSWKIDGIRAKIISNGDTIVKVEGGLLRGEDLGIYGNGANMATQLQDAFDYGAMRFMYLAPDSTRTYSTSDNLNAHGKVVSFRNGAAIQGSPGVTLDSLTVDGLDNEYFLDTVITYTNLRSTKGYLTLQNFGGKTDGSNNVRFITKALEICAANRIELRLPKGEYYIDGSVLLKDYAKLQGEAGTVLTTESGSSFNMGSEAADSISIGGFTINLLDTLSTTLFALGSTDAADTAYNVIIHDITFNCNRAGYHTVMATRIKDFRAYNISSNNSDHTPIFLTDCDGVDIKYIRIRNAGRGGITLYKRVYNFDIGFVWVDGFEQAQNYSDAAIDGYGGELKHGNIHDVFIRTGTTSFGDVAQHNGIRMSGAEDVHVRDAHIICESMFTDHAIRVSLRDTFYAKNVTFDKINIEVRANSLFNNLIYFQGAQGVEVSNSIISIDSNVVRGGAPSIFGVFTEGGTPRKVNYARFRNNNVNFNGVAGDLFINTAPVDFVDMSGTIIENTSTRIFVPTSDSVGTFTWNTGSISSTYNFPVITVPAKTKRFIATNLTTTGTTALLAKSGAGTIIISNNNFLNGARENSTWGGGGYLNLGGSIATTDTLSDLSGFVNCTRTTGNQTFTLSGATNPTNKGRFVTVGRFVTSSYTTTVTNVYGGDDILATGESSTYYCDGTNWYRYSTNKVSTSSGGGGSSKGIVIDL